MTEKLYRYTLCKYDDDALWMDANGALTDFAPVEAFLRELIAMAEEAERNFSANRANDYVRGRYYQASDAAARARALLGEE